VLLGEKLTGLGIGKIVGPGGKAEPGESPRETAVREVWEEVGLRVDPAALISLARIEYPFHDRPHLSQRSHAFATREWTGDPVGTAELAPRWWPVGELPLERMWSDATLWLPRVLAGEHLEARFGIGLEDEVLSSTMEWTVRADRETPAPS
jgi:8-oxo-dGTP diphosphatase